MSQPGASRPDHGPGQDLDLDLDPPHDPPHDPLTPHDQDHDHDPHRDPRPEAAMSSDTTEPTTVAPTRSAPWADVVVQEPTGPALGTLVWGCTALAVAVLLGAWELAGLRVDLGLALPVGMVALGLLLVVGAVVTAVRQRR